MRRACPCEQEAVKLLMDFRNKYQQYTPRDGERYFDAVQNAQVVAAASMMTKYSMAIAPASFIGSEYLNIRSRPPISATRSLARKSAGNHSDHRRTNPQLSYQVRDTTFSCQSVECACRRVRAQCVLAHPAWTRCLAARIDRPAASCLAFAGVNRTPSARVLRLRTIVFEPRRCVVSAQCKHSCPT